MTDAKASAEENNRARRSGQRQLRILQLEQLIAAGEEKIERLNDRASARRAAVTTMEIELSELRAAEADDVPASDGDVAVEESSP